MLKIIKNIITLPFQSEPQQDEFIANIIKLSRRKAAMKLKSQQVDGFEIAYVEREARTDTEQNKLPTVVLVHGFSANKDHWLNFSHLIDKKYRVIIPDLAGHGDSSGDLDDYYGLVKQAERLKALLNKLNIHSYHLLGNSMGGAISSLLYHQYPEKVASLGLMNTAGIEGEHKSDFFSQLADGNNKLIPQSTSEYKKFLAWLMHKPPFMPWPFSKIIARQAIALKAQNEKIFADMLKTRDQLLIEKFELQLQQHHQQYPVPVFVMWGDKDQVLDISTAYYIQKLIPQAELNILENIGHLPMLECPEKSGSLYNQFLITAIKQRY